MKRLAVLTLMWSLCLFANAQDKGNKEQEQSEAQRQTALVTQAKSKMVGLSSNRELPSIEYLAFFKNAVEESDERTAVLGQLTQWNPTLEIFSHADKRILRQLCDERSSLFDKEWVTAITFAQAAQALACLEAECDFKTSTLFASAAMNQPDLQPVQTEVLALIAARGLWFTAPEGYEREVYRQLIRTAIGSANEMVSSEARNWAMAVTCSSNYDALQLAAQILEVSQNKIRNIGRSFYVSHAVCSGAQQAFERTLRMDESDHAMRDHRAAQILGIASQAAIHQQQLGLIEWAEASFERIPQASTYDRSVVSFWKGSYYNAHDRMELAAKEYRKVFLADVDLELKTRAGAHLASCIERQGDIAGAIAVLEEVNTRCKAHADVSSNVAKQVLSLQERFPAVTREDIERSRSETLK